MYEKGKRLYYVESLLLPSARCTVIECIDVGPGKDRYYITAKDDKTGKIFSDYGTKFSTTKTAPYFIKRDEKRLYYSPKSA